MDTVRKPLAGLRRALKHWLQFYSSGDYWHWLTKICNCVNLETSLVYLVMQRILTSRTFELYDRLAVGDDFQARS